MCKVLEQGLLSLLLQKLPAPEEAALFTLANKFAYGTPASPSKYSDTFSAFLPGSLADYVTGERGVPALVYMLGAGIEGQYFTRCSVFNSYLSANLQALTRALKSVWAPYTLPVGPELSPLLITVHFNEFETWWELWTMADTNILKDPDPDAPNVASAVYSYDLPPWEQARFCTRCLPRTANLTARRSGSKRGWISPIWSPDPIGFLRRPSLLTVHRAWLPRITSWFPSRPLRPLTAASYRSCCADLPQVLFRE
jgi:hypothetical protein